MKTTNQTFFLSAGLRTGVVTSVAVGVAIASGSAFAAPKTIQLPNETATYKQAVGSDIANAQCMICHSADYVKYQPPTTNRATWVAEIKKMQHTFGAPIPDDQIAPLADYLAKNYGNEQGK